VWSRRPPARAQFGRTRRVPQIAGRIDQREMREGLRKIAELAPVGRIVFLGRHPTLADGVSRTRSYLQCVFDLRRDSEFGSFGITASSGRP
jgi:hypothetical protein